ncbi:MAG: cytochrome P460 family protein [Gammaproteobacteria bacterium]|nr:cytochrome P460 family protein [Gammaproteobacteria bacterium]
MKISKIGSIAVLAMAVFACAKADTKVDYPENFQSWNHVKSMVLYADHALADPFEGIHHIYANDVAMDGFDSNKFAEGSVIVFDLFENNEGGGALQEGPRKLTGVMVKDSKHFSKTGGWGFEGFAGSSKDERLVSDGGAGCYACHESNVKESDYVFSKTR